MQKLNGGYVMIDLNDTNNIYARAKAAIGCGKPIMIFDDPECYYADSISLDGDDNVVITKGGKTITIESDGDVTKVGNVLTIMENIVDLNGNKRFVDFTIDDLVVSGITPIYSKASLSGTHLMLVYVFDVDNATTLSNTKIAEITLPKYIMDKIFSISSRLVDYKIFTAYADDLSSQNLGVNLFLSVDNAKLEFIVAGLTANSLKHIRIQFDLLIDAE